MIQINNWDRGTGKTTKVIEMFESNPELYCIVPSKMQKQYYPKHLQNRILSGHSLEEKLRGCRIRKVILDEGFLYPASFLARLYYKLGSMGIDTYVYGTE